MNWDLLGKLRYASMELLDAERAYFLGEKKDAKAKMENSYAAVNAALIAIREELE